MSKESFGDIAKKLAGEPSNSQSKSSEPKFKSKPLNEGNDIEPKFRSNTEYFERNDEVKENNN